MLHNIIVTEARKTVITFFNALFLFIFIPATLNSTANTTNSAIAVVIAAPSCCISGIKKMLSTTLIIADAVLAVNITFSLPSGIITIYVINDAAAAHKIDIERIFKETVASAYALPPINSITPSLTQNNPTAIGTTKRTNILAVIIPQWICDSFYHPFFLQVFRGISNCAKNRGYFIMYGFKEEDDDTWINRFIQSNFVEGILLFHEENDKITIKYLKDIGFPFVSVSLPDNMENALNFKEENEKFIHEANGKYLGSYISKIIMDKLESKNPGEKYYIINTKLIEKEPLLEKIKSMVLYNRNIKE